MSIEGAEDTIVHPPSMFGDALGVLDQFGTELVAVSASEGIGVHLGTHNSLGLDDACCLGGDGGKPHFGHQRGKPLSGPS